MSQDEYARYLADVDMASVQQIASDYGLDYQVLSEKLPRIVYGTELMRDTKSKEPDTEEARRYIKTMISAAEVLREKITTFPINSSFHAELFYKYKNLYMLGNDLDDLITVLDNLDPSCWKERNVTKIFRDSLIYQLAELWKSESGKPIDASDKPGHFLAFLCGCADLFGIDSEPLPERFRRLRKENKGTAFEI